MPENRAFAGESCPLTLRLINDKLLPVPWIEVRDPVPEGVARGRDAPGAGGSSRATST